MPIRCAASCDSRTDRIHQNCQKERQKRNVYMARMTCAHAVGDKWTECTAVRLSWMYWLDQFMASIPWIILQNAAEYVGILPTGHRFLLDVGYTGTRGWLLVTAAAARWMSYPSSSPWKRHDRHHRDGDTAAAKPITRYIITDWNICRRSWLSISHPRNVADIATGHCPAGSCVG